MGAGSTSPGRPPAQLSPTAWGLVLATAAIELMSTAGLWDRIGVLGWIWIRPSVVPALLLLGVLGRRLTAGALRWAPACAVAGGVVAVEALRQPGVFGGASGLAGFALAALQEEVVYRGVLPLAVWFAFERAGVRRSIAWMGALVVAAGLFAVQPNHVAQGTWPFFAFAVLFCLCVRRPDGLIPAALVHMAFNLLAVGTLYGETARVARTAGTLAVLGAFILTAFLGYYRSVNTGASGGRAGVTRPRDWEPALAVA